MKNKNLYKKLSNFQSRAHRFLFGMKKNDGFIYKLVIYALLISIGFVYLYPVLYMLVTSFMSLDDLINSMVKWIPTALNFDNYTKAMKVMNFKSTFFQTLIVAGVPSILQTASTAIIGYGFARFKFPFKNLLFALMLTTFIIPPQVTVMPTYLQFKNYELLGSIKTFIYPAILGQGLKSAIFILIFYQFYRQLPNSLEEAAQLDGASHFKIFYKIALPTAVPAIVIVFLFSFVWYWNETYLSGLFFGNQMSTLPLELQKFADSYGKMFPGNSPMNKINESIKIAGTMLVIAPLLVLYFALQRWFVESIDRTGITGE